MKGELIEERTAGDRLVTRFLVTFWKEQTGYAKDNADFWLVMNSINGLELVREPLAVPFRSPPKGQCIYNRELKNNYFDIIGPSSMTVPSWVEHE